MDDQTIEFDWTHEDTEVLHDGSAITLPAIPAPMDFDAAIATLERKKADAEQELSVVEIVDAFPQDALVAINAAMRDIYGWASPIPKMTFFGPQPPQLVTVQTGPKDDDKVQVPTGLFSLPNVTNPIEIKASLNGNGQPCLLIVGHVRKADAYVVKELAQRARDILKTNSIYKGKAIRLLVDSDGDLSSRDPQFMETDNLDPNGLILNPDEFDQVTATLWAPIENTEACLRHKIPLNRGVLLEGTYGCGKTMTAHMTSKVCVDNGWTYIMIDDVRALKDALLFAQRYQPAVVFAEDVDRVAERRDQEGNDLLNVIDGVLTKDSQVITVLTTNHVERINKAMLRAGRLDAVISVRPPEPEAAIRLMRLYGRNLIDSQENLDEAGEAVAGNIPATIREIVERSKLAMIANGRESVTSSDLVVSANGMAAHLALLAGETPEPSVEERAGIAIRELVSGSVDTTSLEDELYRTRSVLHHAADATEKASDKNEQSAQKASKVLGSKLDGIKEDTEVIRDEVA